MSQAEKLREELQHISLRLEARASQITADLIAAKSHFDSPENLQTQTYQSSLTENPIAIQEEMADFASVMSIIQGYITLMKTDVGDPIKFHQDLDAISDAISKSALLVQAWMTSRTNEPMNSKDDLEVSQLFDTPGRV
jgi:hypothetical protein